MRPAPDGRDPHEGGGEDVRRLAGRVHDEAALNLHVGVGEAHLLRALQGLGVYCHRLEPDVNMKSELYLVQTSPVPTCPG